MLNDDPLYLIHVFLDLEKAIEQNSFFLAAGITIYLYDYFLTISDELRYVWRSPFSLVKILFLLNRYLPLTVYLPFFIGESGLIGVDIQTCQHFFVATGIINTIIFATWAALTSIRVHALYGCNSGIGYCLTIAVLASFSASLGLAIHFLNLESHNAMVFRDLRFCYPGDTPRLFVLVWIPATTLELALFSVATYKILSLNNFRTNGLHRLLIRDGVLYFIVVMAFRIANFGLSANGNPKSLYYSLFLMIGTGSALVSRFVLNLKSWSNKSEFYMDDAATRLVIGGRKGPLPGHFEMKHARRMVEEFGIESVERTGPGLPIIESSTVAWKSSQTKEYKTGVISEKRTFAVSPGDVGMKSQSVVVQDGHSERSNGYPYLPSHYNRFNTSTPTLLSTPARSFSLPRSRSTSRSRSRSGTRSTSQSRSRSTSRSRPTPQLDTAATAAPTAPAVAATQRRHPIVISIGRHTETIVQEDPDPNVCLHPRFLIPVPLPLSSSSSSREGSEVRYVRPLPQLPIMPLGLERRRYEWEEPAMAPSLAPSAYTTPSHSPSRSRSPSLRY